MFQFIKDCIKELKEGWAEAMAAKALIQQTQTHLKEEAVSPQYLKACMWPVASGPRIDLWISGLQSHTFGYWSDGSKAGVDCPPEIEVELVILDGNYPGAPNTRDFYQWVDKCRQDPSQFNTSNYCKEFLTDTNEEGLKEYRQWVKDNPVKGDGYGDFSEEEWAKMVNEDHPIALARMADDEKTDEQAKKWDEEWDKLLADEEVN